MTAVIIIALSVALVTLILTILAAMFDSLILSCCAIIIGELGMIASIIAMVIGALA